MILLVIVWKWVMGTVPMLAASFPENRAATVGMKMPDIPMTLLREVNWPPMIWPMAILALPIQVSIAYWNYCIIPKVWVTRDLASSMPPGDAPITDNTPPSAANITRPCNPNTQTCCFCYWWAIWYVQVLCQDAADCKNPIAVGLALSYGMDLRSGEMGIEYWAGYSSRVTM